MFKKFPVIFWTFPGPFPRICPNIASAFPLKIRHFGEVQYHLHRLFLNSWTGSSLIFFLSVPFEAVMAQIFQPEVRIWSIGIVRSEIEVFDPQAWDSHLRHKSWLAHYIEGLPGVWENNGTRSLIPREQGTFLDLFQGTRDISTINGNFDKKI